jgi:hypothetical protein
MPVLAAAVLAAEMSYLPFDQVHRYTPPADPGHFKSNGGRSRSTTRDDTRAFRKRIAKRRAKKGYA